MTEPPAPTPPAPSPAPDRAPAPTPPVAPTSFGRLDPRRSFNRLVLGGIVGLVAAALVPDALGLGARIIAWWNSASLTALLISWVIILRSDARETHRRAAAADPGRTAVWLIVTASSVASVFAATVVLHHARGASPEREFQLVLFSVLAVISAWATTHTAYTLRYAHVYYRDDDEGVGGAEFPGGRAPDYRDFAYLAFTVGMCFQVSDVTVSGRHLRHSLLSHALLSFAYNTVILALALNLLGGLVNG